MPCDDEQSQSQCQQTASLELSEADFCNTEKLEQAKAELIKNVCPPSRELVRPHISRARAVLNVLLALGVSAGVFCLLFFLLPQHGLAVGLGVSLGLLAVYIIIRARALCIWCIKVYQRYAPEQTRLRCVFTPSCSEYAILALNKYGVLRAIPKIISRLKRCHPPNGGIDEP